MTVEHAVQAAEDKINTNDDGLSAFMRVRPRLYGIAYRMLRSATEAEDIVQDVWLRWQKADRSMVLDAAAFLATTTRRLAINVIQSARSRRESSIETSLLEPVDPGAGPGVRAERCEALAGGVRLLLERLTPTERAAYVLREAFDYPYRDIASALRLEVANARQVVTRARQHVANGRRVLARSTEQGRLLDTFVAAVQHGDVAAFALSQVSASPGHSARRSTTLNLVNRERDINHETRHHRGHRAHRLEARDQAA